MNFAETVDRRIMVVERPYVLRVTGVYVLRVARSWQGPVRILLHREGVAPITVWGAPLTAGIFHRVEFSLYPGQGWSAAGGVLIATGEVVLTPLITAPSASLVRRQDLAVPEVAPADSEEESLWG